MDLATKIIKSLLLILLLAVLFISWFNLTPGQRLDGFFKLAPEAAVSSWHWTSWKEGNFQQQIANGLNDHLPSRNLLVRTHNQLEYSLFHRVNAHGFMEGKNGYLYQRYYIHEYLGHYFIGQQTLDEKLEKLKFLQDTLRKKKVFLLPVIEPGKASYFPEHIPGRFYKMGESLSNYTYIKRRMKELGINHIDLNELFIQWKDTSRHPLFPRHGMHWSLYGVGHAIQPLIHGIEEFTGKPLPGVSISKIEVNDQEWSSDYDIGTLMNLLWRMPSETLAYPSYAYDHSRGEKVKNVLVLADSYYINLIGSGISSQFFEHETYWYYYSRVYPYISDSVVMIDTTHLQQTIESKDLILLMSSEINLHNMFFGFIDDLAARYDPKFRRSQVMDYENRIKNEITWYDFLMTKARNGNKSLEQVVKEDAEYMFVNDYADLTHKTYLDSVDYQIWTIRQDGKWFEMVKSKADGKNIPLAQQLREDAEYVLRQRKDESKN